LTKILITRYGGGKGMGNKDMADNTEGYLYDVFISYPHEKDHKTWVVEFFLEKFELFLTQDIGRPVKVYLDQREISPGIAWPQNIKHALGRSRVIIPVWSVNYFLSNWCKAECCVMLHRETQLGYRTDKYPNKSLIIPVRLFDGQRYPQFAKEIECFDCTAYNVIFEDYKKTPQYYELLQKIKGWTPLVAEMIDKAPPWSAEFLTPKWLDEPIQALGVDPNFHLTNKPFELPAMGSL
jgi:hypothetical protein